MSPLCGLSSACQMARLSAGMFKNIVVQLKSMELQVVLVAVLA